MTVFRDRRRGDMLALAALGAIFVLQGAASWQRWGDLTVDCGREMTVAQEVARGRILYRDFLYPYGPLVPYWHGLLMRIFGEHLNVLYGAGLAVCAATVAALYRLARRFLPPAGAFAAGAAFLSHAFDPALFNFVLPYAFPATYGCLLLIVAASVAAGGVLRPAPWRWPALCCLVALLLLDKQEFGAMGVVVLAAYVFALWRAGRPLPGLREWAFAAGCLAAVAAAYGWFVWQCGLDLLLRENFLTAPQHYFSRRFGAVWTRQAGLPLSPGLAVLAGRAALWCAFWTGVCFVLARLDRRMQWGACVILGGVLWVAPPTFTRHAAWHEQWFLLALVFAALLLLLPPLRGAAARSRIPGAAFVLAMAALAHSFRFARNVRLDEYPIYYNSLVILAGLVALRLVLRRASVAVPGGVYLLLALAAWQRVPPDPDGARRTARLETARGTIVVAPQQQHAYAEAVAFLTAEASAGKRAVILPEDTSLYFLSGMSPPLRWYGLAPGFLEPGDITRRYLEDFERARPDYVLLGVRHNHVYGVPYFGIDYDQPVLAHIERHYAVRREFGRFHRDVTSADWGALLYERR